MAKYYVQMYSEYPIYEPAEGGYYYAGRTAEDLEDNEYKTIQEAIDDAKLWVEELNEGAFGDEIWTFIDKDTATVGKDIQEMAEEFGPEEGRCLIAYRSSKYIGEGAQLYIEIPAAYRKNECGWHPYE